MDPPELASELAPCYARRGRIEPPGTTPSTSSFSIYGNETKIVNHHHHVEYHPTLFFFSFSVDKKKLP